VRRQSDSIGDDEMTGDSTPRTLKLTDETDMKIDPKKIARMISEDPDESDYDGLEDADEFIEEPDDDDQDTMENCDYCDVSGYERSLASCTECDYLFCGFCGELPSFGSSGQCKKCIKSAFPSDLRKRPKLTESSDYDGLEDNDRFYDPHGEEGLHLVDMMDRWVQIDVTSVPEDQNEEGSRSWIIEIQVAGQPGTTMVDNIRARVAGDALAGGDAADPEPVDIDPARKAELLATQEAGSPDPTFKPFIGRLTLYYDRLDVGWLAIQGDEVTGYDWNGPELKEEDIQAI